MLILSFYHSRRLSAHTSPERFVLQLCDFGCSKRLVSGKPNIFYICALFYRAPELLLCSTEYSVAVDMWSFGCVLAELILGCPLFANEASTYQQLIEVLKVGPRNGATQMGRILPRAHEGRGAGGGEDSLSEREQTPDRSMWTEISLLIRSPFQPPY